MFRALQNVVPSQLADQLFDFASLTIDQQAEPRFLDADESVMVKLMTAAAIKDTELKLDSPLAVVLVCWLDNCFDYFSTR